MDILTAVFGEGKDLTTLQICARSFAMFFITLVLIRVSGMRMFGKKSAFDGIMVIMLGAILSRGVVGANPFGATVAAGMVMVILHRVIGWICTRNKTIEKIVKGEKILLYNKGTIQVKNLGKTAMSQDDLLESLRLETKKTALDEYESAYMETNGRISFIEK